MCSFRTLFVSLACACALGTSARGRAQDEPEASEGQTRADLTVAKSAPAPSYGASARLRRPMAARNTEDATAAGTELVVRERPVALETTAEAIREVPGTRLVRQGPYGTFSGVQLRGSALGQTAWVFEDVPLSSADGGGFDLSTLPLPLLARLEVYRGGAPLWISQGALGGVVRAKVPTADGTGAEATVGAGSFGRVEGRASARARGEGDARLSHYSALHVVKSDGNFPYTDDGGTVFNPNDDQEKRLRNAQTLDAAGLTHTRLRLGSGHLDLIVTGFERSGGVPSAGGAASNTRDTHRNFWRALAVLAYTNERLRADGTRHYRLQVSGSLLAQRNRLSDPVGELSRRGTDFRDISWRRGWGRVAGSYGVTRWLEMTALVSHAYERNQNRDLVSGAGQPARRSTTSIAGELRLHGPLWGKRVELRPSVLAMRSEASIPVVNISRLSQREVELWLPVVRVGAALELSRSWTLRSSVANGGRLPSTLELFGDPPFVRANRELVHESGWNWDGGLVASGRWGPLRGELELNVYWQQLDDLIVFERAGGNEVRADNVNTARLWGTEVGLDAFVGEHLHSVLGLTTTVSENHFGDELPGQPRLRLFARQELPWYFASDVLATLTPYVSVEHVGRRYQDSANIVSNPAYTRVGLGLTAEFFRDRLEIAARVEDVFDARGQDVLSFPLPGRAFFIALTLREELT